MRNLLRGLAAGAVGTTALNTVTYTDMVLRGRAPSQVPARAARRLAESAGLDLGDGQVAQHRQDALGSLLGYVTGLGVGAVYGLLRPRAAGMPAWLAGLGLGAAAMAASDIPLVSLGLTKPAEWGVSGWLADIVPHAAYGLAAAVVFDALSR
ncbi:hypothetical protein C3Y87_01135 [Carbonactinospora thermoautotrophica]|uniref:hypothetical protein n=1 Tax=Carbonactinospora thermoautotrophica TaxID=1469144 RepID=UPI00226E6A69|nr:hypothetical protein [Carbonactinospora thermoautotrophica]MCX9190038.1 hypothetical protein [Carbonactinospora thermoautotrophica]